MSENVQRFDMDVKHLEECGLLVPYEQMSEETINTVKTLLMDAILATIAGYHSISEKEELELRKVLAETPGECEPVLPVGVKTSLEMAGFLNGFFLRYPDWADTLRMPKSAQGHGGHPSDQIAAALTLCNLPGITGKKLIELIHLSYQLWENVLSKMLDEHREYDLTTVLAISVPVMRALVNHDTPEQIQNALNVSAAGGAILVGVRSTGDMTNLKSGATGYAIARALWCYKMSRVLDAPARMFTGVRGSWYHVVAPLEGKLEGIPQDKVYETIEIKAFPCYNVAQGPVELAIRLHFKVKDRLDQIKKIVLKKSPVDAKIPLRADPNIHPHNHASADHDTLYCLSAALKYGALTPKHFENEYLFDETLNRLQDIIELQIFTPEELEKYGGENSANEVTVVFDDGTSCVESLSKPIGFSSGLSTEERVKKMRSNVENKRGMLEQCYGFDLSTLADIVYHIEEHNGHDLLQRIHDCVSDK